MYLEVLDLNLPIRKNKISDYNLLCLKVNLESIKMNLEKGLCYTY